MGLRPKALLAALALVALVTGGLTLYVGRLYEDSERRRIEEDLARDAARLDEAVRHSLDKTRYALRPVLVSQELTHLLGTGSIKEGLDYFAKEWCLLASADVAVVAVDGFVAKERQARVLGETGSLAVCGLHVSDRLKAALGPRAPAAAKLLAHPRLGEALERAFAGRSEGTFLLSVGDVAFYGQALPFNDRVQEGEKVGVAVVLVALTDGWIRDQRQRSFGPSGRGAARQRNPVQQVIFVGNAVSGTSLEDRRAAALVLQEASRSALFQVRLGPEAERFIGWRETLSMDEKAPIGVVALKSLDRELGPLRILRRDALYGGAALGLLGAAGAFGLAYLLIRRVEALRRATVRIREGDFETRVPVRGKDEIAALAKAMNDMTEGLKALELYTDPALARNVLENAGFAQAEGVRREGSVFFCDVAGFTAIAERTPPETLVERLNRHFALLGDCLREEGGYLDKFNGDAVMAFWGPPFVAGGDFAERACRAALASLAAALAQAERDRAAGTDPFLVRIGIATGPVVVGNIGSRTKKNYTVIGDTANLASRLEGANKRYGSRILVDGRTRDLAVARVSFREVDQLRVAGKETPVRVFEPLGLTGRVEPARLETARRYEAALGLYRRRDFKEALKELDALLEAVPHDGPGSWLAGECERLAAHPPHPGWEAVTTAEEK